MLLPAVVRHPSVELVAAADPDASLREAFRRDFNVSVYEGVEGLCERPQIDAIYIATPTPLHCGHALAALASGKHVVVEKPMAVTMADADAMVAAAESAGRILIVGHSQSFEPPIRAMRELVHSGSLGALRMAHNQYYTDWLYRPRSPVELEREHGGGVLFRQGIHQADLLRWICGGMVRSVRASIAPPDAARPGDGAHTLFLDFEGGTTATAVFGGYDHFNSAELTFGVGEAGRAIGPDDHGRARRALNMDDEAAAKRRLGYARDTAARAASGHGFYGLTIVSCERGDIRQSPGGLTVYGSDSRWDVAVAAAPTGRDLLLDELVAAVRGDSPPAHDGRWGRANLEVIVAGIESSRTRAEVMLSKQTPVPPAMG
jgi:phthalate 4,5-cis-dihydrodiol dehydrogenase